MQTIRKARAYLSFLLRRPSPFAMPAHYLLEPTSRCNLRCTFCPYSIRDVPDGDHGFMGADLMERILDMMSGDAPVAGLSLHLGGEPLLHPGIDRLVELVHARLGIRPRLATNGTLLSESVSNRIARAGGAHLEIDYCGDPDTFERQRIGASWSGVRDNISNAVGAGLELSLIALDGDIGALRSLFGESPRIHYGVFRMHNTAGEFADIIEKRFRLATDRRRFSPCTHLWFSMSVTWKGEVVVCCRDILHRHVVGDLTKQTIADVWYGSEMKRVRKLHASSSIDSLPLCRSCDRPYDPVNRPLTVLRRYSPRWKP